MRWGWIVAGSSLFLFSVAVGKWGHEYKPVPYNEVTAQTAILTVEYEQPNAAKGKIGSLILALGAIACFKAGAGKDEQITQVRESPRGCTVATPHPHVAPIRPQSSPVAVPEPTSVQYDSEDLVVPALSEQAAQTQPEKQQVSVFSRMIDYIQKHLMIVCATGSGKTTFILGLVAFALEKWGEKAEFYHSTAKAQAMMGLEDVQAPDGNPCSLYISRENPESVVHLRDRLKWLNKRLSERGKRRMAAEQKGESFTPPPIRIILDEFQKTLILAEEYDEDNGTHIKKDLSRLVTDFAISGREDDIALWILSQNHQVQNVGINQGMQEQFGIVVLGRKKNLRSAENAMHRAPYLIPRKTERDGIWQQIKAMSDSNPKRSVCYSNLCGHEVLEVPYLPDIKRKRIWGKGSNNVVEFPTTSKPQALDLELEDYWA